MKKAVVLIHGLLARAYVMRYIQNKMIKEGYVVYLFDYDTRKYSSETLQNLHQLISTASTSIWKLVLTP